MNKKAFYPIANLVAVLLTFGLNSLANALPLNGQTTGEISDRFPVFFVPASYVFTIWFVIYALLIAFAIYQIRPSQWDNPRLQKIGPYFLLSCVANVAWLFLWHYEIFPLTLVAMVGLLLSLITIYLRLGIGRTRVPAGERWLVHLPFSVYVGWVTVATIANVTWLLYFVNWSGWGIPPEIWAVIMLVVGGIVATAMSLRHADVGYLLVIIWAFIGIAVKQAGTPVVATSAWVLSALVAVILVVGFLRREQLLPPAGSGV